MKALSISRKLVISYSLLIVLVVMIILFTLSSILSGRFLESAERRFDQKLGDITAAIEQRLMNVIDVCDDVKEDPRITRALAASVNPSSGSSPIGSTVNAAEITAVVEERYASKDNLIGKLILINRNLEILDPVYARVLYRDAILTDEDFIEFLTKRYTFYFSTPGTFPIDLRTAQPGEQLTIVLYQRLLDQRYWIMGYLLSVMRKDVLFSPLWETEREDLFTWIGVFNNDGRTIFTEGEELEPGAVLSVVDEERERYPFSTRIASQRYIVSVKQIPRAGWFVVGLSPLSLATSELHLAFRSILLIGVGFLLAGILMSYFIARTITHPLAEVTAAMRAYDERGSLEKIGLDVQGELGYLVRVYNKMVESINQSIRNIYEEQEKKKEAELLSLEYELDFLQAQINPHFIYNTLNAIGYQAERAGNTGVFESLRSFNILLKAAVSGIGELVPMRHEISLVKNFLLIQRLRYGDRFDVEYDVSADLLASRVPKLILQPIVENAVFHGIEPSRRHGRIRISARGANGHLEIEVEDNGVGFDRVNALATQSQDDGHRRFNRIGLANVNERVKILFGAEYGLDVRSSPGSGTTVTIRLPDTREPSG